MESVTNYSPGAEMIHEITLLVEGYVDPDGTWILHSAATVVADALLEFIIPFKFDIPYNGELTDMVGMMYALKNVDVIIAALVVSDLQSPELQRNPEQAIHHPGRHKIWSHA